MGSGGIGGDAIVWQHYLLRHRMLMQAKPRKGGQIRFTCQQLQTLEKRFGQQKYLSPDERKTIASQLALSERQIKTWFQNRRAKWRRCKQLSVTTDPEEDKHILFDNNCNKCENTHSWSRDNHNDDPYETFESNNTHNYRTNDRFSD
ncbi:hematopoietically-expressed homeobox protein hhex-like [Oppia nitens]|uniref:hematopoietically-expressed homeobox protein hhex-like n=1 Tax=Oppia nitens TaxID=1686743 RepID=UPI0023DB5683|nr:hematopoietically-expressed homeobox protein hhex-like [Oppia nitens]